MTFNKPLYRAAGVGKLDECKALLLKNADVNWQNPYAVVHYSMNQALLLV